MSQDNTKISNKHGYISVFVPRQYQDFKQTWLHFCECSHLNMSMEYNYKKKQVTYLASHFKGISMDLKKRWEMKQQILWKFTKKWQNSLYIYKSPSYLIDWNIHICCLFYQILIYETSNSWVPFFAYFLLRKSKKNVLFGQPVY